MPESTVDVVQRLFGAFARNDRGAVAAGLSPDIVWRDNGHGMEQDTWVGRDAVLTHLFEGEPWEDYQLQVTGLLAGETQVAVLATTTAKHAGRTLVNDVVQIITLADGLVAQMQIFAWDPVANDEFLRAARA